MREILPVKGEIFAQGSAGKKQLARQQAELAKLVQPPAVLPGAVSP